MPLVQAVSAVRNTSSDGSGCSFRANCENQSVRMRGLETELFTVSVIEENAFTFSKSARVHPTIVKLKSDRLDRQARGAQSDGPR
jgi:hypothetical protein